MKMFKTKSIHFAMIAATLTSAIAPSYAKAQVDYASPYTRGDYRDQENQSLQIPNGIPTWIAEKLASGIVGAMGAQIFSELEKGLGVTDKQSEILNLLNQVMARLDEIQNSLSRIETDIKIARYETGIRPITTDWDNFSYQLRVVLSQNKQALANMKDGKVIDPAAAARIAANIKAAEDKILDLGEKLITSIHGNFTPGSDLEPLQKVFAQIQRDKMPVIDSTYFQIVNDQLEKYRSLQVVALALMADIQQTRGNKEMVQTYKDEVIPSIRAETLVYPENKFFTLPKTMKSVMDGDTIYDRTSEVIWLNQFMTFNSAVHLYHYGEHRAAGSAMPPSREMVQGLLNAKGLALGSFTENAKKLGIKNSKLGDEKMVVVWAWPDCDRGEEESKCDAFYMWFGNDRDPRQYMYEDNDYYFNRVRQDKQMPLTSFKTLSVIPVSEINEKTTP
ncbi:hypothetical protein [Bdellovibrio sp. HCB209]|uniref:hypothetical protein n=1 Tax=Bdellovibrio sp. HCB209 TaxID=3394354 RepID=UPI0039B6D79D